MTETRYKAPPPQPEGTKSPRAQELTQLFEQHNRTLVSFLAHRLGNLAEAKEVAQEAYVRMLQLDEPGAVCFLRAYLFKTAANIALGRIRHRACAERHDQTYDTDDLTHTLSPDRELHAAESFEIVRQALLEVDPRHRQAFLLHRFEDKTSQEIGRELRISDRQARTWIQNVATYCRLRLDGLSEREAKERLTP